jgi:hypothetical protein
MRYAVENNPAISQECKTYINNRVNAIFSNDDTEIYRLSSVLKKIEEQPTFLDKYGVKHTDISALKEMYKENVHFIEF